MTHSLVGGLIADGCDPKNIWVSNPTPTKLAALQEQFGVNTTTDNSAAANRASVVVLAVKPQLLKEVATQLTEVIQRHKPLVTSIAAGVREPDLGNWFGGDIAIVRAMPNTPSLVGSGATGLYANKRVSSQQRQLAESILRAVGVTVWVKEEIQLDAVTAVSGSGPAYFFLVMEAMEKAGVELGLSVENARLLTLQTAFGAAKMALESTESPAILRTRVTSPGGTTERAIAVLQEEGLEALFAKALSAASQRSRELGDLLGERS